MPLDQAFAQPAAPAESSLEAGHTPSVTLVIIAKEVQESMKGEDTELGLQRMARFPGLAPGDPRRNDNIAQITGLFGWK